MLFRSGRLRMKTRRHPTRFDSTVRKNSALRHPDLPSHRPRAAHAPSPSTRDPHPADLLADELRHVIERAEAQSGKPAPGVLLDKEFHGFRVVLTRTALTLDHPVTLSPREIEIARMIGKGFPNKMIADVLEISAWTVGTHLRRIFAKLRVCSRAAMVAKVLEQASFFVDSE